MSWYNVSGEQAQYLMSFLHAQFCYANPYIRTGLFGMVLQMKHRMLETISLHDKTSEQEHEIAQLKLKNQELEELKEHEIAQLKIKNRELEELNETLEFENLRIPQLQVLCLICAFVCFRSRHAWPQNQVDATQTHFANYVEETREMQANASRVDELESINTVLKINLADSKQRRLQLETELKSTKAKIHSSLDLFKENVTPFSFPVMQNNGHMVDFHRIISKWAKTAEEDDNTASRSFMCSIENKHTSLVQPRIIDQIQRIAIELGLRAEPPLLFELKTGDAWVQLSNKHHIQLIATVCYLYANRKAVQTADTVVNKERLSFVISTVRVFYFKKSIPLTPPLIDSPTTRNPSFVATKPTPRSGSGSIEPAGTPSRT
jgi:hypothetical protein